MTMSTTKADRQFLEILKSRLNNEVDNYYTNLTSKNPYDKGKYNAYEDIAASINDYLKNK